MEFLSPRAKDNIQQDKENSLDRKRWETSLPKKGEAARSEVLVAENSEQILQGAHAERPTRTTAVMQD